ncbi:hypothetical protein GGF31_003285 [Allomyces arbusculus]|nr:hypothetical protein GGF31_003285 [Allomyces arbusculus]
MQIRAAAADLAARPPRAVAGIRHLSSTRALAKTMQPRYNKHAAAKRNSDDSGKPAAASGPSVAAAVLPSAHSDVWNSFKQSSPARHRKTGGGGGSGSKAFKPLSGMALKWKTVDASTFTHEAVQVPNQAPVAELHHGLDRVLFNPGVHFLQDPRTGIYNFDPYLQRIVQPEDINFDSFSPFIIASRDKTLTKMAADHGCSFFSSTSSISGALSQMYFMISGGKPIDITRLSQEFSTQPATFTKMSRSPATILLRRKGSVYSIDADKSIDQRETVLSQLGKSMERMLTCPRTDFTQHLAKNPLPDDHIHPPETYFYGKTGKFMLRAQLDCIDPRLPRKTFDLKTRAALAVRMDADNYAENTRYHLRYSHGLFASFEREYYDMIRAAFLKYSLQVRIGQMDGIFVAFHNTARIFGFQYISLEEMDSSLFGSSSMGDQSFAISVQLLQDVLEKVVAHHGGHPLLRVTIDSDAHQSIFVEEIPEGADPTDANLEKLDPASSTFDPPRVSRIRLYTTSTVNGRHVEPDAHPMVRRGDQWKVRYAIEVDDSSDHAVIDYYRLRRSQYLAVHRARRPDGGQMRAQLERHFVSEDEARQLYDEVKGKPKVMYTTRNCQVPVDAKGVVHDDGWDM